MDPLGNVPVFLSVLSHVPEEKRKKILFRELIIALVVLLLFFFLGNYIMAVLHLTADAISISGGIILFLIAIKMIFPSKHEDQENVGEPFIVPMAIPLIAGPSALAVILLIVNKPGTNLTFPFIALLIAWAVVSVILYYSTFLYKVLKQKGLTALERLMGMLLVIISVQMLLDGLKHILK